MNKLHLIRHGATDPYEKRLYYGSTDVPLSENGIALLKKYKSEENYPSPEGCRIITSGMRRTNETLRELYGDLPYETIEGFREMDFGIFEMKSYNELKDSPEFQAWCTGDNMANVCPGGESGNMFASRVRKAFADIRDSESDILAVIHGGVIWAIMSMLFDDYDKTIYEWQPVCGCGYTVEFKDGQPLCYYSIPL